MPEPPRPTPSPLRLSIGSGAKWESVVGYARAVRAGDRVFVTGTTATIPDGGHVEGDAYAQACQVFRNIERALAQAGARLRDVVRTRMFVTDIRRDWQAVGRAHAEFVGAARPATTMVEVSRLIEDWMLVEIEADAIVGSGAAGGLVIESATEGDRYAITDLLRACRLPVPEEAGPPVSFLVARLDGRLAGCIGLERHGEAAMLRSAAVEPSARGAGIGRHLVQALLGRAASDSVGEVYLLTIDAMSFFAHCGFAAVDRALAPRALLESPLFKEAHCSIATLMRRNAGP